MSRSRKPAAPTLPGLFVVNVEPMARPPSANDERDRLLRRVAEKAEERHAGFLEAARRFVLAHLALHGPTSAEQLTFACKAAEIVPDDDRAFGPVYMALARQGLIEKVGSVRRERGHGATGGNLWTLVGKEDR